MSHNICGNHHDHGDIPPKLASLRLGVNEIIYLNVGL